MYICKIIPLSMQNMLNFYWINIALKLLSFIKNRLNKAIFTS